LGPEVPRLLVGVMMREMGEKFCVVEVGEMGHIITHDVADAFQVIM